MQVKINGNRVKALEKICLFSPTMKAVIQAKAQYSGT